MTFLNSPKRFVIQSPIAAHGLIVHESIKRATHAVLVRRSARDTWQIYDVYESQFLADAIQPTRLKTEEEIGRGEKLGTTMAPWENSTIRPVEGFVHPVVWHGRLQEEAEERGEIPTPDQIPPSEGLLGAMLEQINKHRAILKLDSWVIDNTAMKPGFYMLYEGKPGKKFGHPNGIGQAVEPKGMNGFALVRFLSGALKTIKEAAELTYQPTNIDLDNEELEYLRGQLNTCAPQLRFRIDQAIRQAKKKKD